MTFNTYTLGELVCIKYGKNQKKVLSNTGSIPIYGTGGLMGYATEALYNKPSVLIGRKGTIDKIRYVDHPFWTVDTLFYTIVNENIVIPHFLYYTMLQLNLLQYNEGTTIPSLRTETLNRIELQIPDTESQKMILHYLATIDDKIAINTAINENLEQQAQAIFKSWFVDFEPFGGVMPADWRIGTFSDIIDSTLGGDWGKEEPTGNFIEPVYCIRGADIPEVKVGNKGKMPTRYILQKNFKAKQLVAGDIVVEISGGSPTQSTGRVAIISKALLDRYNRRMICTNFCRAVKPMKGYSKFIYYYWKYLYDMGVFFSYENGTTGIKNLDISGFIETEIIMIPPVAALNQFNDIIEGYFSQIFENGQEGEKLAVLRDTLLPKLMNGEIDISKVQI